MPILPTQKKELGYYYWAGAQRGRNMKLIKRLTLAFIIFGHKNIFQKYCIVDLKKTPVLPLL